MPLEKLIAGIIHQNRGQQPMSYGLDLAHETIRSSLRSQRTLVAFEDFGCIWQWGLHLALVMDGQWREAVVVEEGPSTDLP